MNKQKIIILLTLFAILLAGLYVRLDAFPTWQDNKNRFFFAQQQIPLMLTVDSYFYLEIAKQLQDGTFTSFEKRRQFPTGYHQAATPPLLSVLLARISSITNTRLEWVALFSPAFLAILLGIPVYLITKDMLIKAKGKFIHNDMRETAAVAAGLIAAFTALLSPMFAGRSSLGWCDTDPLNAVLPVLLAWLAFRFSSTERVRAQTGFLIAFGITTLLFLWWWDQSHIPVFALAGIPFVIAAFVVARHSPKKIVPVLLLAITMLLLVGFWKGFSILNPIKYLDTMLGMLDYITSDTELSPFRAGGASVSEQAATPFSVLVSESCGGLPGFFIGCGGLVAFLLLTRFNVLFLAPLLVVAILSVNGQRFLVFTAPFFGIGIGTVAFLLFQYIHKITWRIPGTVLLIAITCWGAVNMNFENNKRVPRRLPVLFDAMQTVEKKTEQDAVIWASWGHGHPLLHYGQRAILADGMFHSSLLQYVINFAWAADNFRLSANWMCFYVQHGTGGLHEANALFGENNNDWAKGMAELQQLLAAGIEKSRNMLQARGDIDDVEKQLKWLFPSNSRPIYMFLDYLLPTQAWYVLGRWNLATRTAPRAVNFSPLRGITMQDDRIVTGYMGRNNVTIDTGDGKVTAGSRTTILSKITLNTGQENKSRRYNSSTGMEGIFFLPARKGLLADRKIMDTVLVKLYYEYTYNKQFFKPVAVQNPYFSVWEVFGERYISQDNHE